MANQGKFGKAHDKFLKRATSNEVVKGADQDQLKAY